VRGWSEIEAEFRSLRGNGLDVRVDHQDGSDGEYWRLAGASNASARAKFNALARMAGEKLLEVPAAVEWAGVAQERDPVIRWYRALRHLPGAYELRGYGIPVDNEGNETGLIGLASIRNVYEMSAALCATLESLSATPRRRAELLCSVPRYSGPCQHWRSAQAILNDANPDYGKAAHEAVSAVEGLCRVILGDPVVTLGAALNKLRRDDRIHPALAKSIDGLWGFASAEPGVRHGAPTAARIKPHEAQYVVESCDAALVLLLALDGGA
jgi:hypothetical protein